MPNIAKWGSHRFDVSPNLISSFRDLSIKGSTETTDKTANNQKYVERKAGEAAQVSFTVQLNALTGVRDVYGEAQQYVSEAMEGKTEYMYLGPSKIIPAKLMLTQAEITEIVMMPGKGNVWISCDVKLTMKQGTPKEGTSVPPSGGSDGYTVRIYYSTGSGVVRSVTYTSKVSITDARKKAQAMVPRNAMWSGENPKMFEQGTGPKATDELLEIARKREEARKASEEKEQKYGLDAKKKLLEKPIGGEKPLIQ